MLDEYRRSFSDAYEYVVGVIRNELMLEPTGRPAKSTTSIVEKLLRESIRLTQIQDIAGCRLVVSGVLEQERVISLLIPLFPDASVVDRRASPSHGYRAVHVIVSHDKKVVEVQVRTALQHVWAELSEKLSDVLEPAIKYGGGEEAVRSLLSTSSGVITVQEESERILELSLRSVHNLLSQPSLSAQQKVELVELQTDAENQVRELAESRASNLISLQDAIDRLERLKTHGDPDAIPD